MVFTWFPAIRFTCGISRACIASRIIPHDPLAGFQQSHSEARYRSILLVFLFTDGRIKKRRRHDSGGVFLEGW
jgi:hypothetical protein